MLSFMRTLVDIPESMLEQIDDLAKHEKISRAEAVRRAITEYIGKRAQHNPKAAFGIWKLRKINALVYEDKLRKEWKR